MNTDGCCSHQLQGRAPAVHPASFSQLFGVNVQWKGCILLCSLEMLHQIPSFQYPGTQNLSLFFLSPLTERVFKMFSAAKRMKTALAESANKTSFCKLERFLIKTDSLLPRMTAEAVHTEEESFLIWMEMKPSHFI